MTTNDGCRADVRKARAEAAGVDEFEYTLTRRALRQIKAEAWDEGATKASPYGGGYLRSLLIENPYRADRLATDTAAPEGDCLAGPACVRLTTDGCRPVCGFAPGEFEDRVSEWSPVEPETSEPEGGESRG